MAIRIRMALLAVVVAAAPLARAGAQTSETEKASLDCVVQPSAVVKLGSSEQGIVTALTVDRGASVKKGQIVARLDSRLQSLALNLAQIRAESDVEIRSARVRLEFRKLDLDRAERLHQRQAMASKKLEEAGIERQLAQLALETAQLQQRSAKTELEQAQERLERRFIRSSVDGVVLKLGVNPGEYVYEQVSIMTIAAIDPLHVEVFAPLSYYGRLTVGMKAEVDLDPPLGGRHMAVISAIDRVHDPASRTFGVRLDLPNPSLSLPGGVNCRVRFVAE